MLTTNAFVSCCCVIKKGFYLFNYGCRGVKKEQTWLIIQTFEIKKKSNFIYKNIRLLNFGAERHPFLGYPTDPSAKYCFLLKLKYL